jgi:hypothetical protein
MTEHPIPPAVHAFLLKNIDSIGELEALLLLRAEPGIRWTLSLVAQRLYITEAAAGHLLAHLMSQRLVVQKGGEVPEFRYHPESAELEALVADTCEIYARHLVPVTNLIHSKGRTRIQEFADAFKLRRND